MTEKDLYAMLEIEMEVADLSAQLNKILEADIRVSDNIEKASGWLFFMAVTGGLIAIFSVFWIAMVSLGLAIVACGLLIYKSEAKLKDHIDINFWFLERCMKISSACAALEIKKDPVKEPDMLPLAFIDVKQDLITLKDDREAFSNDVFTPSLLQYYQERNSRSRYSAAIKNKYNRHGIKEPM